MSLAEFLSDAGNADRAMNIAESIMHDGWKGATFAYIASALANIGNANRANQIFLHAISIADSMKNARDKDGLVSSIAIELAKAGRIDKAIHTVDTVRHDRDKNEALSQIAMELAKAGDVDRGINVANSIGHSRFRAEALSDISIYLAKTGNVNKATNIANSFDFEGADASFNSRALAAIATQLALGGNIEKAIDIAKSIQVGCRGFYALAGVAVELAEAGKLDNAIIVAKSIKESRDKVWALSIIATALANAGNTDMATKIYTQAFTIADSFRKYPSYRARAITAFAVELIKASCLSVRQQSKIAKKIMEDIIPHCFAS